VVMGELVARVYDRTKGLRWIWVFLVLAVIAASLWSASRARFSEDLFDALPRERTLDNYRTLLDASGSTGRIVVGFSGNDTVSMDSLSAHADRSVHFLQTTNGDLVDSVFFRPDPTGFQTAVTEVRKNLPLYADSGVIATVAHWDSVALLNAFADLRNDLARPGAEMDADRIVLDPFGLSDPLIDRVMRSAILGGMAVIDGQLFTTDSAMAVVVVMPSATGITRGKELMQAINGAIGNGPTTNFTGTAFGAVPMAVANADRIADDATMTSIVAVLLIIGLLIWRYRSVRIPLLFFVPPAVGFIIGLGAIAAVRPVISALSLGASAALLGIALDYCFHFFTHLKHTGSIRATLKDVAGPMLLGCFTTVLAFAALSFVGSRILADLGFIAAFLLIGAALTVLFVLPHFAPVPQHTAAVNEIVAEPKKGSALWNLLFIGAVTAVLLPFVNRVSYDNNPEHISYISPEMSAVRDRIEGDTARAVPLFWSATGANEEEARQALENSVDHVRRTMVGSITEQAAMPTDLWPSNERATVRVANWKASFHGEGGDRFKRWFVNAAIQNGFTPDAFDPFLDQLDVDQVRRPAEVVRMIGDAVLVHGSDSVTIAGRMLLPPDEIAALEPMVGSMKNTSVLHRGMLSERIQELVGSDLNAILWRTSLIVFIVLLLTYGRIELALLTFLPMALGWFWILGICGLFGIQFNLVNILVCTFVFGLGDDYCIFTTEGLLARYKTGVDHTRSYRNAVVLSVVTTIIGTGVLLFAEHPALRSIATLSVIGMVVLLVISLTVQPVLFRLFIGGRAAAGKQPFTLFSFLISGFAFLYFLIGCILTALIWLLLLIFPAPKRIKQHWLRHVLRAFTGSLVYAMANTSKDIQGYVPAIKDQPAIIIANHASFIDILAMLMFSSNVVMMTNRWVWNSPFFGRAVRYAGYLRTEDGVEVNTERVREAMAQGLSVIIFPEGTRTKDGTIGRFHKGAFHIAEALQVPIVPVVLHGFGKAMSKNDALLKNALLTIRTLPVIQPSDPQFGEGDRERTKKISAWYKAKYEEIRSTKEGPVWYHEQLMRNFMYKGPVLEWHTRIKARMDAGLHDLLHKRIPIDARIVDLGSGHGMVSFLLGWSAPDRVIQGYERDADKVAIANNAYSRSPNVTFSVADLEGLIPPPADAYILKDVLHYLPPIEQRELILACAKELSPKGAIFVRDGFAANDERHDRTKRTERYSVGLGFNQAKGELHFMTKEGIVAIAKEAGLNVEWATKEMRTSNELVILTKG